jgi:hypothetical protein
MQLAAQVPHGLRAAALWFDKVGIRALAGERT